MKVEQTPGPPQLIVCAHLVFLNKLHNTQPLICADKMLRVDATLPRKSSEHTLIAEGSAHGEP